jgi:hypothetical protein
MNLPTGPVTPLIREKTSVGVLACEPALSSGTTVALPRRMDHYVARAREGTLLFNDWNEARGLWDRLAGLVGLLALVLMPDHIHVLLANLLDIRHVLAGYARWRNARRGEIGPVWLSPIPAPERVGTGDKRRRSDRYVHLNPPRAGIASCPLDWAFSTHRDAVGLAAFPVRRTVPDPVDYHRYVSSDPSVRVTGTLLPSTPHGDPTPRQVLYAVSAVTRTPLSQLTVRGPERTLLVRSLRALTTAKIGDISDLCQITTRQVHRVESKSDRRVQVVSTVIGDPRFGPLFDEDLSLRWRGWNRARWADGPIA